ncbi:ABC transporter permease [Mycolicibacterium sp. S2-37]|uniref:ABC transporter permease n=1 Tax=Mycolicibacterium sp. S2-37 TaxID=2810297 RepID=UPI001A93E15C|nr:ABC transporter permease [Mycolicibacterium sp. S2-37]MBO0676409.1 ABC transporter permease [Mycolicibacterium sp. S2-37]
MTALAALTERVVRATVRDFDLLIAVLTPVSTFVGFTVVLRGVIDTGAMSYPQYVLPAIIVQSLLFGSLTTADRAARDQLSGFGTRLRTLPIRTWMPLAARMLYCLLRAVVVIVAAVAVASVFGFRFTGGYLHSAAFVALALALTLGLSLGADAIGTWVRRVDASSQVLLVPQLLLVLLSTGMAPVEAFPGWVQPFVRAQPVSQVTETLRGFAVGQVSAGNLATSLAWLLGMLVVFGTVAVRIQRRVR